MIAVEKDQAAKQQRATLEPRHPDSRLLALNFALLSAGESLAKLLTFAAFAYLARALGAGSYGVLEFVLASMVFFTLPADLGLGAYGAREIARAPHRVHTLLCEITQTRILLAGASFLLLLGFAALLPKPAEVKLLLGIYGLSLLLSPALLQWFFQAHDRMHLVALASILRQAVFAGGLFLFFKPGDSVLWVGLFEMASVAAVAAFCLAIVRLRMGYTLPCPTWRLAPLLPHVRQGLPIGLTELAWAFMWYFATVLLGLIFSDESLGWFGAAHRVLMALHTFVWLYFFNLLPSMSRCVNLPFSHLLDLMNKSTQFAAWVSIFVAFVMSMLAREALVIAYGSDFAGADITLAILVWILPVAMLSGHHRYILIAYNRQTTLLRCTAVSAAGAVLAGLALAPLLGSPGAALALLAANITNFALVYYAVRRHVVRVPFLAGALRPLPCLAAGCALFYTLRQVNIWTAAAAAVGAYLALMIAFHGHRLVAAWRVVAAPMPDDVPARPLQNAS